MTTGGRVVVMTAGGVVVTGASVVPGHSGLPSTPHDGVSVGSEGVTGVEVGAHPSASGFCSQSGEGEEVVGSPRIVVVMPGSQPSWVGLTSQSEGMVADGASVVDGAHSGWPSTPHSAPGVVVG